MTRTRDFKTVLVPGDASMLGTLSDRRAHRHHRLDVHRRDRPRAPAAADGRLASGRRRFAPAFPQAMTRAGALARYLRDAARRVVRARVRRRSVHRLRAARARRAHRRGVARRGLRRDAPAPSQLDRRRDRHRDRWRAAWPSPTRLTSGHAARRSPPAVSGRSWSSAPSPRATWHEAGSPRSAAAVAPPCSSSRAAGNRVRCSRSRVGRRSANARSWCGEGRVRSARSRCAPAAASRSDGNTHRSHLRRGRAPGPRARHRGHECHRPGAARSLCRRGAGAHAQRVGAARRDHRARARAARGRAAAPARADACRVASAAPRLRRGDRCAASGRARRRDARRAAREPAAPAADEPLGHPRARRRGAARRAAHGARPRLAVERRRGTRRSWRAASWCGESCRDRGAGCAGRSPPARSSASSPRRRRRRSSRGRSDVSRSSGR